MSEAAVEPAGKEAHRLKERRWLSRRLCLARGEGVRRGREGGGGVDSRVRPPSGGTEDLFLDGRGCDDESRQVSHRIVLHNVMLYNVMRGVF